MTQNDACAMLRFICSVKYLDGAIRCLSDVNADSRGAHADDAGAGADAEPQQRRHLPIAAPLQCTAMPRDDYHRSSRNRVKCVAVLPDLLTCYCR